MCQLTHECADSCLKVSTFLNSSFSISKLSRTKYRSQLIKAESCAYVTTRHKFNIWEWQKMTISDSEIKMHYKRKYCVYNISIFIFEFKI